MYKENAMTLYGLLVSSDWSDPKNRERKDPKINNIDGYKAGRY